MVKQKAGFAYGENPQHKALKFQLHLFPQRENSQGDLGPGPATTRANKLTKRPAWGWEDGTEGSMPASGECNDSHSVFGSWTHMAGIREYGQNKENKRRFSFRTLLSANSINTTRKRMNNKYL